jgi:hypothetical protein
MEVTFKTIKAFERVSKALTRDKERYKGAIFENNYD